MNVKAPMAKYSCSKVFAERAAWTFAEDHKGEIGFDIAVIHPSWVFGPAAAPNLTFTSSRTIFHNRPYDEVEGWMYPASRFERSNHANDFRRIGIQHSTLRKGTVPLPCCAVPVSSPQYVAGCSNGHLASQKYYEKLDARPPRVGILLVEGRRNVVGWIRRHGRSSCRIVRAGSSGVRRILGG